MSKFSMRLAAVIAASTVSVAGAGFAAPALAQTTSEAGAEATPGLRPMPTSLMQTTKSSSSSTSVWVTLAHSITPPPSAASLSKWRR